MELNIDVLCDRDVIAIKDIFILLKRHKENSTSPFYFSVGFRRVGFYREIMSDTRMVCSVDVILILFSFLM